MLLVGSPYAIADDHIHFMFGCCMTNFSREDVLITLKSVTYRNEFTYSNITKAHPNMGDRLVTKLATWSTPASSSSGWSVPFLGAASLNVFQTAWLFLPFQAASALKVCFAVQFPSI